MPRQGLYSQKHGCRSGAGYNGSVLGQGNGVCFVVFGFKRRVEGEFYRICAFGRSYLGSVVFFKFAGQEIGFVFELFRS